MAKPKRTPEEKAAFEARTRLIEDYLAPLDARLEARRRESAHGRRWLAFLRSRRAA